METIRRVKHADTNCTNSHELGNHSCQSVKFVSFRFLSVSIRTIRD